MEREKTLDAVAMTRRIRDDLYEQLKDAGPEERIRIIREKARQAYAYVAEQDAREDSPSTDVSGS